METPPPCPITGQPATRLIQTLGTRLLGDLWRLAGGVDARPLFGGLKRFELWESPCGLAFFHPPVPGDAAFYEAFYRRIGAHAALAAERPEMRLAAGFVPPGGAVLDVGCGGGAFAAYLDDATYVGLEPHFRGAPPPGRDIRAETIEAHRGSYDMVAAFQVIEHVADPLGFARAMAARVRPGGLLVLGVPAWPSRMTAIPNFLLNAPPHHLSWWSEGALRALAERLGLEVVALRPAPLGGHAHAIWWAGRLAGRVGREPFFKGDWRWHARLVAGWLAGRALAALRAPPADASIELLLVARKAGGA